MSCHHVMTKVLQFLKNKRRQPHSADMSTLVNFCSYPATVCKIFMQVTGPINSEIRNIETKKEVLKLSEMLTRELAYLI